MCFTLINGSNANPCCNPRPVCRNVFTSATTQYIQGPIGPAGPAGPAGVCDAIYAWGGTQAVAAGQVIPLAQAAATPTTQMTVSGNAVNLPAGTYQVSFGGTGAGAEGSEASTLQLSLQVAGTPVSGGVIAQSVVASEATNLSKTMLYTATSPTSLALANTSPNTIDFTDAFITVLRLA